MLPACWPSSARAWVYSCAVREPDWHWLGQAVPWLGLLTGAGLGTFSLLRLGSDTLIVLPVLAAMIGVASATLVRATDTPTSTAEEIDNARY